MHPGGSFGRELGGGRTDDRSGGVSLTHWRGERPSGTDGSLRELDSLSSLPRKTSRIRGYIDTPPPSSQGSTPFHNSRFAI